MRARGTARNPANRFETLRYTRIPAELGPGEGGPAGGSPAWGGDEPEPASDPRTELLVDASRSIVATNASPDVGFDASVNPYRGCEHGCVYCYARPTHETLGFSAGLDFETRILVKPCAPELLARRLAARSWRPQVVALSGVTDPYQPAERRLELTRGCLRVLADFRNPVVVVTKSWLVTRDLDLLGELAAHDAASVLVSVTSLDPALQHRLEPRASRPAKRLAAIERLAAAGIPVGVMVAPVIPGLTDQEIPAILQQAADAGASFAGTVMLRLPHGVKDLFSDWLSTHFPERREKVLNRLRALHGGSLYDPRFGHRQRGTGIFAEQIHALFELARRRAGLAREGPPLSTASFRRPETAQLALFQEAPPV
jgi:DNA repair photolyase